MSLASKAAVFGGIIYKRADGSVELLDERVVPENFADRKIDHVFDVDDTEDFIDYIFEMLEYKMRPVAESAEVAAYYEKAAKQVELVVKPVVKRTRKGNGPQTIAEAKALLAASKSKKKAKKLNNV